ncbi:hypothetical protein Slala03_77880 [Streptomyces lavendulae subsp. lavendulae]|nr:hypothetical protein Slala03_77880 [Streptomyces lavendulae subsp. lavendulae]
MHVRATWARDMAGSASRSSRRGRWKRAAATKGAISAVTQPWRRVRSRPAAGGGPYGGAPVRPA